MTSYNQHVCYANWRKAKARQIDSKYNMVSTENILYVPVQTLRGRILSLTLPFDAIAPATSFANGLKHFAHFVRIRP